MSSDGYLSQVGWLLEVAGRAPDDWTGFDQPRSEQYSDWASKFQCAYTCYALTAAAKKHPQLRAECAQSVRTLVHRMLAPRCWDYWISVGDTDDPVAEGNVMYSGHLLTMIGCLESLVGPSEFDRGFRLEREDLAFEWDHHRLAERIREQMRDNPHHGVACQRGFVFVQCTNFGVLGLRMYDALHGTSSEDVIAGWLRWIDEHFVVHSDRGVFYEFYDSRHERMDGLSFRGLDASGLMTLSAIDIDRARALYDKYVRIAFRNLSDDDARLRTRWLAKILERLFGGMLDKSMTEAFTYVLARNLDDTKTAERLRRSIIRRYGLKRHASGLAFDGVPSPLAFTALMTLGDGLEHIGDLKAAFDPSR